jgi:hypothetical protein
MHLVEQSASPFMLAAFEHFSSMMYPLHAAAIALMANAVHAHRNEALLLLDRSPQKGQQNPPKLHSPSRVGWGNDGLDRLHPVLSTFSIFLPEKVWKKGL